MDSPNGSQDTQDFSAYTKNACHAVPDEVIWHNRDPFCQVLEVAFVSEDSIAVFTYRLCQECGVSMDRMGSESGTLWTCGMCGSAVREV